MILTFLIIGIYALATYTEFYSATTTVDTSGIAAVSLVFKKFVGVIIGMFILSILISIGFLLLIKNFPSCMVYGMIILVYVILVVVIIIVIVQGAWGIAIALGIMLLIMTIVLFCFWDRIKIGILLLQVSA